MTEKQDTAESKKSANEGKVLVAGHVDPEVWDKCLVKAFNASRAITKSAIISEALAAYAADDA